MHVGDPGPAPLYCPDPRVDPGRGGTISLPLRLAGGAGADGAQLGGRQVGGESADARLTSGQMKQREQTQCFSGRATFMLKSYLKPFRHHQKLERFGGSKAETMTLFIIIIIYDSSSFKDVVFY